MTTWRTALRLFAALTLVTGFAYPAVMTVAARLLFPARAGGSLVTSGGRVVGSALVGQATNDPAYFWPRPSAAPNGAYDARLSGATNLAASNPKLAEAIAARAALLRAADPGNAAPIPGDLLTASGSGLDPDISPEAARWQVDRVARRRALPRDAVAALVERHVARRTLGLFGEPRVNVLLLNLELDAFPGAPAAR